MSTLARRLSWSSARRRWGYVRQGEDVFHPRDECGREDAGHHDVATCLWGLPCRWLRETKAMTQQPGSEDPAVMLAMVRETDSRSLDRDSSASRSRGLDSGRRGRPPDGPPRGPGRRLPAPTVRGEASPQSGVKSTQPCAPHLDSFRIAPVPAWVRERRQATLPSPAAMSVAWW